MLLARKPSPTLPSQRLGVPRSAPCTAIRTSFGCLSAKSGGGRTWRRGDYRAQDFLASRKKASPKQSCVTIKGERLREQLSSLTRECGNEVWNKEQWLQNFWMWKATFLEQYVKLSPHLRPTQGHQNESW